MGMADGTLRDLGLLAEGEATAGLSDEALVGRFLASPGDSSERAFAALVDRHGPMVRGVCRRALRDPGDASDAFQATFLVLARRAGSVRVEGSLGPWLHGVSVRVARRARAVAARRNARERTNAPAPEVEVAARDGRDLDDLRGSIDEELRRLPDIHFEKDKRTCVASVKLEPGKTYAVFLNSPKFTSFRDIKGRPALPYLLVFKTRAAK